MKSKSIYTYLLAIIICFSNSSILFADDFTTLSLDVFVAGTLSTQLGIYKDSIKDLTIKGFINGTDIRTMQNMGKLINLNIADANIVSGGDSYFCFNGGVYSYCYGTEDNKISRNLFVFFGNLQSIITPLSATLIGNGAFIRLKQLSSIVISDGVTLIDGGAFFECTGLSTVQMGKNVTSIGYNAFYNCTSLQSITLPDCIVSIGSGAFDNCLGLTEIHCKMTMIPTITKPDYFLSENIFTNVDKSKCILYVPKGTYQIYRSAINWGSFANIIEEETSLPSEVQDSKISVFSEKNSIIVKGTNIGDEISFYSLSGLLLFHTKTSQDVFKITLNADNIYLVKIGKMTYKISL